MLPILYGYATNGSVKQWSIKVEGGTFTVSHGKKGGKLTSKTTQVKPKNIGRVNETTPEEQAVLEATSKWKKQVDKGYAENIEDAGKLLNPMLAHDYLKQGHRISYPAYAQPKLDGVRCLIYRNDDGKIVFMSRGGKEYPVIQRIADHVEPLLEDGLILDGELYIHGESLQDIVGAVKKHKELTDRVEFWCFDLAYEKSTWEARRMVLKATSSEYDKEGVVRFLRDFKVVDDEALKKAHKGAVMDGFEGIMVRNRTGMYKFNHRSPDLQKYKEFLDEEFVIIGHKVDKDGCVVWKVQVAEGVECDVTPMGEKVNKQALALVAEDYYGKLLKTKFQAYTNGGNLSFPVGIELDRTDT